MRDSQIIYTPAGSIDADILKIFKFATDYSVIIHIPVEQISVFPTGGSISCESCNTILYEIPSYAPTTDSYWLTCEACLRVKTQEKRPGEIVHREK